MRRLRAPKALARAKATSGKRGSLGPLAREIAEAHEPGTLTLAIVNRVQRAQELRALLAKEKGVENVALIHSRFRPGDRRRVQEAALNGSFQGVLVATQAIEAGVDVSAKTLFTELAPWPSLVQRFGRLNRVGEHAAARAFWVDLDTRDGDLCLPYEREALELARSRLAKLRDVGPESLATVGKDKEAVALPVIRSKDVLELFDTEPDLAGHDIDVSRYVRATDVRDVQVAWRKVGKDGPQEDAAELQRDELCSVPIDGLRRLTKGHKVWRFDSLRRSWEAIDRDRLIPGMTVVLDVAVGGYDAELGFTGDKSDVPSPLEVSGDEPDSDDSDALTYGAADYITLKMHAEDTAEEMARLLRELSELVAPEAAPEELIEAARWHDAGKGHPAFQAMLVSALPSADPRRDGGPWAKSDGRRGARNERRFFRHELASALAWLNAGKSSLGAFLIAAHHGKVRLSIRARPGEQRPADAPENARFAHGVCDGDVLPELNLGGGTTVSRQELSLACMELGAPGPSWAERMLDLLERLGPFRLAYLEALVRVADWRASKKRAARGGVNG